MAFRAPVALLVFCAARLLAIASGAQCPPGADRLCGICYPDGSCEYCKEGATLVKGKCERCSDRLCAVCWPTPAKCELCYHLLSALTPVNGRPSQDYPVYTNAAGRCTQCKHSVSSGCVHCDEKGRCITCEQGYALRRIGRDQRCVKCKSGGRMCQQCSARTRECVSCQFGHGFGARRRCVPCAMQGCAVCRNFVVCDECEGTHYMNSMGKCILGKVAGCEQYNRDGSCRRCWDPDVLVGRKCVSCGDDCGTCRGPGVCETCLPGTFRTPAGKCIACDSACESCSSPTTCAACYTNSLVKGRCRRCLDPRCGEKSCPGDADVCRKCKDPAFRVNPRTGRCERAPRGPAGAAGAAAVVSVGSDEGVLTQIVRGYNATRGRYPWMASLRRNSRRYLFGHVCGGSLVHPQVVLTAAHCLVDRYNTWHDPDIALPLVRLGGHELNDASSPVELRKAVWAVVHESFVGTTAAGHDFALLLLDRPSVGRPTIKLPAPGSRRPAAAAGTMLRAIGWGYLGYSKEGGIKPDVLQEVGLEMLSAAACKKDFGESDLSMQFCAGNPRLKRQTCQGDSGGPLFVKGANATTDYLVGLTSWGRGCAGATPGVYADVAWAASWIQAGIQSLLAEAVAGRIPGMPGQ